MFRSRPVKAGRLKCVECERQGKSDPYYDPEHFYRHTRRKDGTWRLDSYCRSCRNRLNRAVQNARYRHDAEFRTADLARRRVYARREVAEHEGERRAQREEAAKRIAALKGRGWTGGMIAQAVGSTRCQVSKWSRGLMTPTPRNVALLRELARDAL